MQIILLDEKNPLNVTAKNFNELQLIFFHCVYFIIRISLNTMTLTIESPTVYTRLGVAISVTGIAQVNHWAISSSFEDNGLQLSF